MQSISKQVPSFFKVLIGDFAKKLQIPPAFTIKFNLSMPKNATLQARRGKSKWAVKVEQFDEKLYFDGHGWQTFVSDNDLKNGNFVLFRLIWDGVFEFVVYNSNCCEKVMETPEFSNSQNKSVDDVDSIKKDEKILVTQCGRSPDINMKNPNFSVVFNKHHKWRLAIPKAFVYEAGIESKKFVIMRNKQLGKVWRVDICWMAYKKNSRYRMATKTGWHDFCNGNSLSLKDRCLFKFVPGSDNIIDVEIH